MFFTQLASKKLLSGFSINVKFVGSIKIMPSLKISCFFQLENEASLGGFLVQFQHLADWHLGQKNV